MKQSRNKIRCTTQCRRKKSYHRSWICNDCKRHATGRKWRSHNSSCVRFHTYCEDIRRSKKPNRTYYSKLWRGGPKESCEICRARERRYQLRMAVESNEYFEAERCGRERKAFKPDNAEARPWKVMPKDSCEVYRARHQKRQQTKIVVARADEKSAGDQIEPQTTNERNRSNSELVRPNKNTSQLEISSN